MYNLNVYFRDEGLFSHTFFIEASSYIFGMFEIVGDIFQTI